MINDLIQNIQNLSGKCQFASFVYRSKGTGELARHTLILGSSYLNLLEKSKLALELTEIPELIKNGVDPELAGAAKDEILKSFEKSIAAHKIGERSEDYTKRDAYIPLGNGLNLNSNDNTLKLFGLSHNKVVLSAGVYKEIKSRPMTIAKDKIKKELPIGRFREFSLEIPNLKIAKINGETLEIE